MQAFLRSLGARAPALPLLLIIPFITACSSPAGTAALVVATTVAGANSPSNEIEQVYYLGLFDPQEQLPQAVYRVTVRGQGSFISNTKFASGWVPANLADTLQTKIGFDFKNGGGLKIEGENASGGIPTGRRLMMFGPEGFREAPRDHRLCIVMGATPEKFFGAVGESLEAVVSVDLERQNTGVANALQREMVRVMQENRRLNDLDTQLRIGAGSKS